MTVKATKDVGISHLQIKQAKQRERSISSFQMVFDPFAYLYRATKEEDSIKIHAKTAASPFSSLRRMSTVSNAIIPQTSSSKSRFVMILVQRVYPFSYENLKHNIHSFIFFSFVIIIIVSESLHFLCHRLTKSLFVLSRVQNKRHLTEMMIRHGGSPPGHADNPDSNHARRR